MKKHILRQEKKKRLLMVGGNKRAEGMRKIEIKMELLFMREWCVLRATFKEKWLSTYIKCNKNCNS